MSKILTAIGLMSGTSLDGVDAAVIRSDGVTRIQGSEFSGQKNFITVPYLPEFRQSLREVIATKKNIKAIERKLTALHAETVAELLKQTGLTANDIDVIGFHGQTIDHRPDESITWQIGDGALLAELTGINVVNDFRTADVKAGGQGAPLVPLYHAALVQNVKKPVAILNIGGVANVTFISNSKITAFDTGSGSALIDDWVFHRTGKPYDEGGKIAASGTINEEILQNLLADSYFDKKPPKSLDRDYFHKSESGGQREWIEIPNTRHQALNTSDGAATLTAFTVESVKKAADILQAGKINWYITGGGRHNHTIMKGLRQVLDGNISTIEELGYNGDALEAEAFAFLAVRSLYEMPITLPEITGSRPELQFSTTGGVFYPA